MIEKVVKLNVTDPSGVGAHEGDEGETADMAKNNYSNESLLQDTKTTNVTVEEKEFRSDSPLLCSTNASLRGSDRQVVAGGVRENDIRFSRPEHPLHTPVCYLALVLSPFPN